jgi:hypothetical protein
MPSGFQRVGKDDTGRLFFIPHRRSVRGVFLAALSKKRVLEALGGLYLAFDDRFHGSARLARS